MTTEHSQDLQKLQTSLTFLQLQINKLEAIDYAKDQTHFPNLDFKKLLRKLRLINKFGLMLAEVAETEPDKKRLCIKYKDLPRDLVLKITAKSIAWEHLLGIMAAVQKVCSTEFASVLNSFEYYGDYEFDELFASRIPLIVRSTSNYR